MERIGLCSDGLRPKDVRKCKKEAPDYPNGTIFCEFFNDEKENHYRHGSKER